jgi:hypothetical protein
MTPDVAAYNAQGHALLLILLLVVRDAIRKGIALRKAGNKKHIIRFVCLFIFNTAGLLPIIYIIFFSKKSEKNAEVAIKMAAERVEEEAKEDIKKTVAKVEKDIKKTVAKVEKLIKAAPAKTPIKKVIAKKPLTKKAPAKKTK